jgi:hypothetical protein
MGISVEVMTLARRRVRDDLLADDLGKKRGGDLLAAIGEAEGARLVKVASIDADC